MKGAQRTKRRYSNRSHFFPFSKWIFGFLGFYDSSDNNSSIVFKYIIVKGYERP